MSNRKEPGVKTSGPVAFPLKKLQELQARLPPALRHINLQDLELPSILVDDEHVEVKARLLTERQPETPDGQPKRDYFTETSRRALRVFVWGWVITQAYENLGMGLLKRKNFTQFFKDIVSRSPLSLATVLALYSSSYRILYYIFTRIRHFRLRLMRSLRRRLQAQQRHGSAPSESEPFQAIATSPYLPPLLAGMLAAPVLLIDRDGGRRTTFALYALTRAVHGAYTGLAEGRFGPAWMNDLSWWWGPHIVFALSNAVLLHSFVMHPDCFPAAYGKLILQFSGPYLPEPPRVLPADRKWPASNEIVDSLREIASAKKPYPRYWSPLLHPSSPPTPFPRIQPVLDFLAHPGHEQLVCATLHPGEPSCKAQYINYWNSQFPRIWRFTAIVGLVSLLLRYKRFKKNPETTLYRSLLTSISTAVFITGSIGTAWSAACFFQQRLSPRTLPTKRFYLQGFAAGMWLYVLAKTTAPSKDVAAVGSAGAKPTGGPSSDIALYAMRAAFLCAWQVGVKTGTFKRVKGGEIIVFGTSMGVLMALWENKPNKIKSGLVRAVLKGLVGESRVTFEKRGGKNPLSDTEDVADGDIEDEGEEFDQPEIVEGHYGHARSGGW